MTIEADVFAHLHAWPSLAALKIYPDIYPPGSAFPVITYQFISGIRFRAHDGDASLAQPRAQFTVFSKNKAQVNSVAEDILAAMNTFPRGTVSMSGPFDDYNPDTQIYQRAVEVVVVDDYALV